MFGRCSLQQMHNTHFASRKIHLRTGNRAKSRSDSEHDTKYGPQSQNNIQTRTQNKTQMHTQTQDPYPTNCKRWPPTNKRFGGWPTLHLKKTQSEPGDSFVCNRQIRTHRTCSSNLTLNHWFALSSCSWLHTLGSVVP